jgi:hypothetical protein
MAATGLVVVISRISVRPWPRSKVTWCGGSSAGKHAASSRSSVGWLPGTPQQVLPAPVEQRFDVASVPGHRHFCSARNAPMAPSTRLTSASLIPEPLGRVSPCSNSHWELPLTRLGAWANTG